MTAAHTPGPWVAARIRLDGNEWSVNSASRNLPPYNWLPRFTAYLKPLIPVAGKYVDAASGMVRDEHGVCSLAVAENAANARLIASAPDLLAFAVALDADWTKEFSDGPDMETVGYRLAEDTVALWRQCRAAISKATGQ